MAGSSGRIGRRAWRCPGTDDRQPVQLPSDLLSALLVSRELFTTLAATPGCGTIRMYGRGDFQPCGYFFFASSSDTEPEMMTSSPCFQFDRRRHLVLRRELQRVDHAQHLVEVPAGGHRIDDDQLDLLVGPDDEDVADGLVVGGGAALGQCPRARPAACRTALEIFRSVSPIIG